MIEITKEQWQAISGQAPPTIVDPESKTEYVVLRKDIYVHLRGMVDHDTAPASLLTSIAGKVGIELSEAEKALSLRVIWMRRMGLDESEITESLRDDPPTKIDQEMKELLALEKLKTIPSQETLRALATKF